jgi:hypothetical protein
MRCYYCYGVDTIEEQLTRFCACAATHPFIVENVPAQVCCQCGDTTHSAKTSATLEKIIKGEAGLGSLRPIRVFDFNNLDKSHEPVTHINIPHTTLDLTSRHSGQSVQMARYATTPEWQHWVEPGLEPFHNYKPSERAVKSFRSTVPPPGTVTMPVTGSQTPRSGFRL